jgi:hypothetical protein
MSKRRVVHPQFPEPPIGDADAEVIDVKAEIDACLDELGAFLDERDRAWVYVPIAGTSEPPPLKPTSQHLWEKRFSKSRLQRVLAKTEELRRAMMRLSDRERVWLTKRLKTWLSV